MIGEGTFLIHKVEESSVFLNSNDLFCVLATLSEYDLNLMALKTLINYWLIFRETKWLKPFK
jgi:hypothetical protein